MSEIQSPRGTRDILPSEQPLWQSIRDTSSYVAEQMGFLPITVPTFEQTILFQRSIGSGTDIMDKELFLVRSPHTEEGKEEYALRPEGTAGIARAYIEHGMSSLPQPVKLYSLVTNFRYDRPQKGRYREHNQISIEYLGESSAFADAWVILCSYRCLTEVGLSNLKLYINTLGNSEERQEYAHLIQESLRPHLQELSPDSQKRLETNPLRILDSKDANDQRLIDTLPPLLQSLGKESRERYEAVCTYLTEWNIPYEQQDRLVRGLDYYAHTAFEWVITGQEGQQSSLGGGGRYDGLITQLGGPSTPAVGAGLGLERIMEALQVQGNHFPYSLTPDFFVVAADSLGKKECINLISLLLDEGWMIDAQLDREGISPQLKAANRSNATAALILGQTEVEKGVVQVKVLESGETFDLSLSHIGASLRERFAKEE